MRQTPFIKISTHNTSTQIPEDFISNHFPDNSKWQLLDIPISKNDYINSPTFSPEFKNLSLKNGIVRSDNLEITFESDHDFDSCTLLQMETQ